MQLRRASWSRRERSWQALRKSATQQQSFLETAASEAQAFHEKVEARQHEARAAAEEVFNAERELEADRRHAMHLLTLAGNARNSTAQAEESLAALEREAERLEAEMSQARQRAGEPGRAERPGEAAV